MKKAILKELPRENDPVFLLRKNSRAHLSPE
jgi:hypothetical protein